MLCKSEAIASCAKVHAEDQADKADKCCANAAKKEVRACFSQQLGTQNMAPLRWGICTAGKMSFDFADALLSLSGEHELVAVAARDLTRAKQFADKFHMKKAYSDYQSLADDSEVDVVYVASTMNAHFEHCKLFLQAGKHVLCEKSLTCAAWQARELVAMATEKRLFLMEGLWSRCFPLYHQLRKLLDSGELGPVWGVQSELMIPHLKWLDQVPETGGAMWDLGVYPLQFAHWVLQDVPQRVHAVGCVTASGADQAVAACMQYAGGRFSNFSVAFGAAHDAPATIFAQNGLITVPNLWSPTCMTVQPSNGPARTVELPSPPPLSYKTNYTSSAGLIYEAEHVKECIQAGLLQSPLVPLSLSLWLQETMDDILQQVGRTNLPAK